MNLDSRENYRLLGGVDPFDGFVDRGLQRFRIGL